MSAVGTGPKPGTMHALEARLAGVGEGEQQAGEDGRDRAPLAEDQRGERQVALAGAHVAHEPGTLGDRQVGAGDAGQHAVDHQRAVAQSLDGDAGRVDRGRILAHGAQAQAEAGVVDHPGDERDR